MNALTRWLGAPGAIMSALARSPLIATKQVVPTQANINVAMPSPGYMLFANPQEITPRQGWLLYKNVSPLAKVADLIADEVAALIPQVRIGGEIIKDHPVLELLEKPGFNRTRQRFIKELTVQYLISGTGYAQAIGLLDNIPVAFDVLKSHFITSFPGPDMWPLVYNYAEGTRTTLFTRDASYVNPRYIDAIRGMSEVVPIYDMDGETRGIGLSRLNAIRSDVEVRFKGMQHNSAMLNNGARFSAILSFNERLTMEQKEDIQNQLNTMWAGSENAGKVAVTSGGDMELQNLTQSARDMDFANLVKIVEDAIITRYGVPVTLYRPEAQTNNNYKQAWYMFYHTAVKPVFNVIYSGLAHVFSERLGQSIAIEHDVQTNPILAEQALTRSTTLFNAHMISRNEARDVVGYEPALGGDTIYGPMGEVPVGEDYFTAVDGEGTLHADDYQDMRRERNPEQVAPGEGELHDIHRDDREQDRQDRLRSESRGAGKKPVPNKKPAPATGAGKATSVH